MKTEITLTEEQAQELERYCNLVHSSPDKVIGQALSAFLPVATTSGKKSLRQSTAFGSWKTRNIDGLSYQQTLREEWPEL